VALEDALEGPEIAGAGAVAGGGSAAVGGGYELEELGLGLAEALGVEAEGAGAWLRGEDAADEVSLFRPEVEGAAVVVGGEGVFGGAEVEEDAAVFEDGSFGVGFEEGGDGRGDLGRGLGIRGGGSGRGHGVKVAFCVLELERVRERTSPAASSWADNPLCSEAVTGSIYESEDG